MKISYFFLIYSIFSEAYAATPISKYMGDYVEGKKYQPGQVVSLDEKSWLCVKKCGANTPGTNPDAWITLGSNVMGSQGPKGDAGAQGPQGNQGIQGPLGPQGAMGPQGIAGPPGQMGPMGIQGDVGPVGPQGERGLQGEPGPQGIQGIMGPMGLTGTQGPQGEQGIQGAVGPQGQRGLQGEPGPKGERGVMGPMGLSGADGAQGPQGSMGLTGARGPTGPQGPQGPAGASGGIKVYDANGQYLGYSLGGYSFLLPNGEGIAGLEIAIPYVSATLSDRSFLSANNNRPGGGEYCSGTPGASEYEENCIPYRFYKTNDCSDTPQIPSYQENMESYVDTREISYENGSAYRLEFLRELPEPIFLSTKIDSFSCPNPTPTDGTPCLGPGCAVNPWPPAKLEDDVCKTFPFQRGRITWTGSDGSGVYYGCVIETISAESAMHPYTGGFSPRYEFRATPVTLPFTLPVALPLRYEVGQ